LEFKDQKVQQAHRVLKAILVIQGQEGRQVHKAFKDFKERLDQQVLKYQEGFRAIKV
jgi:hypothetical protein